MTKKEFLVELARKLKGLPQEEIEKALEYYSEILADRIDDGISEEEAVKELGSIDVIVFNMLNNNPNREVNTEAKEIINMVEDNKTKKLSLTPTKILLLILLFPFWFAALMVVGSLVFAFYAVIWSLTFAYYVTFISSAFGAVAELIAGLGLLFMGEAGAGFVSLSQCLIGSGLFLILLAGLRYAYKPALYLSKKVFNMIKDTIRKLVF